MPNTMFVLDGPRYPIPHTNPPPRPQLERRDTAATGAPRVGKGVVAPLNHLRDIRMGATRFRGPDGRRRPDLWDVSGFEYGRLGDGGLCDLGRTSVSAFEFNKKMVGGGDAPKTPQPAEEIATSKHTRIDAREYKPADIVRKFRMGEAMGQIGYRPIRHTKDSRKMDTGRRASVSWRRAR